MTNLLKPKMNNIDTNIEPLTKIGWMIVIFGVGGFLLWALFAPLDKGVPISGTVSVDSNRKIIQHPTGGIIENILVEEGERVTSGQVLITMNNIQTKSSAEITRMQYFTSISIESRLVAERSGQLLIDFPQEILNAKEDPRVASIINIQNKLFIARRTAIQSDLKILKEKLDAYRILAKEGYVARTALLDAERIYVHQKQSYQNEVGNHLSDVQRESETLRVKLISQDFDLSNSQIRAPVDGIVVGINIFTRGGVISAGSKLMEILPSNDLMVIEGKIPVHLIDKVHTDLKVDLIFSALNQSVTPHIPGIVTHISADSLIDPATNIPYYQLRAKVAPEGIKVISDLKIRPGMPVELFVKTGERTMMNYLMKPIRDNIKTSLTE
jgi:protease secretion system membrane fusion protein